MLTIRISMAWIIATLSLGALGIVLFLGQPFTVKAQEPKRFQYRIVEVLPDTQNMQTKLNEYGASGWELVAVPMGSMTEPRLIFKK
ncbi:MAG: hypothetical protein OEV99_01725 [Nitrospira sp.]|nr:hypothetical protein [Nitrospira sp.]MDH4368534.1 hypothetical protein [Nitrospira sp.]MDH5349022.1 hypothetical protein [Nitrospira sp.]MDH5497006.1 hypothetical protein [Nitrospira sp.]MDH5724176.1 hypothetical protein [Nitrospira sp.]